MEISGLLNLLRSIEKKSENWKNTIYHFGKNHIMTQPEPWYKGIENDSFIL